METLLPEFDSLHSRLDRLERQNRSLKRAGVVAVLVLGGLLLTAQAKHPQTVEAERLVLVDTHGNPRITIGTPRSAGTAVDLLPDEPAVWLTDANGMDRAILTTDGLRLADGRGKPLADVTAKNVRFFGVDGKVIWSAPKQENY